MFTSVGRREAFLPVYLCLLGTASCPDSAVLVLQTCFPHVVLTALLFYQWHLEPCLLLWE